MGNENQILPVKDLETANHALLSSHFHGSNLFSMQE